MWLTPRDLEILSRIHAARASDSMALEDLFPTMGAVRQRLWRLTREGFLKVHRIGVQRVYSLGRRGVAAIELSAREVRVSRSAAAHHLLYAQVRRELQTEGYLLNGQDQVGRATVMRAWRDGYRIAVVVCNPDASPRAVQRLADRLRSLVNPFAPLVDQLIVFGPAGSFWHTSKLPTVWRGRVVIRPLPSATRKAGQ
jgi:hypothetical protein